ncbi:MAG: hypothetical protein KDE14_11550 [Rhodobacteraceae bacterium]|nr:hypothetical protein [Paracoccaceae bacterium]
MSEQLSDKDLRAKIDKAIKEFSGYTPSLETAIGALFLGKACGWKVLYIIHSQSTIRKYEKILGIDFKEQMPAETELSRKSWAYVWGEKFDSFWRIVRGQETKIDRPRLEEKPVKDSDVHEEGNK